MSEPKRHATEWNDALIGECLQLMQKLSIKQTAEKLNLSYNSLRCALRRRGIVLVKYTRAGWSNKQKRKNKRAFVKPRGDQAPFNAMAAMERDRGGCRWPIGDVDSEAFHFCGIGIAKKSFCEKHAKAAYIPIEESGDWMMEYDHWELRMRQKAKKRKFMKKAH